MNNDFNQDEKFGEEQSFGQDDGFVTEENKNKKDKKLNLNLNLFPLFIVFVIIIVVIVLAVVITKAVNNNKKKNVKVETNNIVDLNSELDGAYAFAKEKDHIVVLRDKKDSKVIYNISQGTGNFGEFLDYTYYDKKLYLLFEDSIMSLSLNEGNGVYELKKEYNYEKVKCKDGTIGKTTNIIVTDDIIYFNNSSCAISGFNYSDAEKDEEKDEEKEKSKQVNIYQFNTLKYSNMTYDDGVLYFSGDNKLFKVSEEDGEIKEIAKDVTGNYPLSVEDGVLIYSNKSENKTYNFFGISTESFVTSEIVKNAKGLGIYNQTYYYYDNNGVYAFDGENIEKIYSLRYNELSNFEIFNGVLQIEDKSTIGDNKVRITNIDLKDNNKNSVSESEYSMIRNIKK